MICVIIIYPLNSNCEARDLTGDKRYVCGLQHYVWYPFETEDSSLRKILIVLVSGICQSIFVAFHPILIVYMFGIPHIIKLRIVDLREKIEEIDPHNIQKFEESFPSLVDYYTEIFG